MPERWRRLLPGPRDRCAARDPVHPFDAGHCGGAGGNGPAGARTRKPRGGAGGPRRLANSTCASTSDDRDRNRRRSGAAGRRDRCASRISRRSFCSGPKEGEPYLSRRPALLRRRLLRLLKERERPSRLLNLRHTVAAHRVPTDGLGIRIVHRASTSRRAGIFPTRYLRADEAAHAAVREDGAEQRISAQQSPHT